MKLHLFSTDISGLELIDYLSKGITVTCVIVPSNRQTSTKVKTLTDAAVARGLPTYIHKRGHSLGPDLPSAEVGISWLYSQIISVKDLKRYPAGILNMHGGAIPEYRGASVLQWAIINGEEEMGITWHEIVEEVDAGPIWAESKIPIPLDATAADMRKAMIAEGLRLFPEAWARFRDPNIKPRYPSLKGGRVWPQRKPEDGLIDKGWSERRVRDMVRALCPPWPPAFIKTEKGIVFIESVSVNPEPETIAYLAAENRIIYLRPIRGEATL